MEKISKTLKISLEEITKAVDEVPALPDSIIKVMDLYNEAVLDRNKIEQEIMKDQGLTATLLKMANSAFYRGRREIKTVAEATILLGFDAVKILLFAATVEEVVNKELKGYAYDKNMLWKQSQISGYICKKIAVKINYCNPDFAYITGLLKDMGMVIMDKYVSKYYTELEQMIRDDGAEFCLAEQGVIGYSHCQLGARLAEKWRLPKDLCQAIKFHHNPNKCEDYNELVAITHIANDLLWRLDRHQGIDSRGHKFYKNTLATMGLNEEDLDEIMVEVNSRIEDESLFIH